MNALHVENLTKKYPRFTLEGVSLTLERGRIMGLIGKNGAGKTTALKAILHLISPDGGRIEILGLPWSGSWSAGRSWGWCWGASISTGTRSCPPSPM